MVNTNTVLTSIAFSQTIDWNIKQFFNSTSIKSPFELKRIGKAITRRKDQMAVEDDKQYKRITIKTNCGGVFVRDEVLGKDIKTKNQYYVKAGQLAVSKIDARNGAFGIVPPEADGAIITGNFWVYDVDPEIANIDYLILLLSSNVFVQAWQDCSNGSGNRLYLQEDKFLNYKIPLPSISKQNQIIMAYNHLLNKATNLECEAINIEKDLRKSVFDSLGIKMKKKSVSASMLNIVRFQNIRQWGYDKIAIDFPYSFEKYKGHSLSSNPSWLKEIYRGKSPKYQQHGKRIILNQKCNRTNKIDLKYAKTENELWFSKIPCDQLTQINDIVINSTGEGTLGRASLIVSDEHVGLAYDSHMLLLRVNLKEIDPLLFVYLFNSPLGQRQVDLYKSAQATKQTELGIENTKRIRFPLPPLAIQKSISNFIEKETLQIGKLHEKATEFYQKAKKEFEEAIFGE